MKNIFLMASFAVGLIACSDNGQPTATETKGDSTNHGAHQPANAPIATGTPDTAGMAGKTMMSIMQSNMDQMKAVQSSGNPDNDFASLMKVHHLGAIEMAQLELAKGTDPELKQLAQKTVDDQQNEIAQFNTFLSGHTPHGGGDAFYKAAMSQMSNMKMDMDHSGSVDKQFAQMMIPHHQGAIDMANAYLKNGGHEEDIKKIANAIISSQQKEIAGLQGWLAKNK
jgi:uncharacterized protein (DUF305 family)